MALTKADATALLAREVPVTAAPVLDAADQEDLVALMATVDEDGYAPSDDAWTETYARSLLPFAAARAWERKAARVANLVTYTADGATINAGELHEQCLRMARKYLARCSTSVAVPAAADRSRMTIGTDAEGVPL